ncbi:MAG: nucleotide disphospho-sugar-binding domain-containing protein [Pseudomonadota bacterium]
MLATLGSLGDLNPFLGFARTLLDRGHRVSLLAPAMHAEVPMPAGLQFHGLGTREAYQALVDDPELWHPRRGFAALWGSVREGLGEVGRFVQALPPDEPCVLLAHPLVLPAAALARAVRPQQVRIVGVFLAPSNLRSCHDPLTLGPLRVPRWVPLAWRRWLWRRVDERMIDPVSVPRLNQARAQVGLPPVRHFLPHLQAVPDLSLTLFPEWFAPTPPDWPQPLCRADFPLHDPHAEAPLLPALTDFLAVGAPPIVFTPGTGHRHAARTFAQALQAVQQLGRRAVFVTPYRDQVPTVLPPNVLWLAQVSFRRLLPQAAALVHHGGIGTTAEALRAGVPQLVLPVAFDQFDNAERLRVLGVGDALPAHRVSARRLAQVLASLLSSDAMRAQCQATAARFQPVPGEPAWCRAVESLAASMRA